MTKKEMAKRFAKLHVKGKPVLLYNAWDAGSASSIAEAGAQAIATSSMAVAAAQGYEDGEEIPLDFVEKIIERITATVDVPVTVDFEGGYSEDDAELERNISRIIDLGVIGINFEDRVVKGSGLYSIEKQAHRISVLRKVAKKKGVDLFINARTDLFLGQGNEPKEVVDEAIKRGNAYAAAGASGLFIPGLDDPKLIRKICESVDMPVNVMMMDGLPSVEELAKLGVSRISWGPTPFFNAMDAVKRKAVEIAIPASGFMRDAINKRSKRSA